MKKAIRALATSIFVGFAFYVFLGWAEGSARWPGYTQSAIFVSPFLSLLWLAAGGALWSKRAWRIPVFLAGILSLALHGILLALGLSNSSLVFVGGAALVALCTAYSFSENPAEKRQKNTGEFLVFPKSSGKPPPLQRVR